MKKTVNLNFREFYAIKKKENSIEILTNIISQKLKVNKKSIKKIVWKNSLEVGAEIERYKNKLKINNN